MVDDDDLLTRDQNIQLTREADDILKDKKIEPILDCKQCGAELALKMLVIPGEPPKLSRLAYNCQNCFAMNVVWTASGSRSR